MADTTLMAANAQWRNRPDDERYTSLSAMQQHFHEQRRNSAARVVPSKALTVRPIDPSVAPSYGSDIAVEGPGGNLVVPSHYSFGQLAQRVGAPAGYLRTLPADIASDALNHGLQNREQEDLGVLLRRPAGSAAALAAVTGPAYGRIWNSEVVDALVQNFGDGVSGAWKVPGEFGKAVEVTKANTTLYASDRDMWVFLADESRRIPVNDRRDGHAGEMARGIFVWNSEVGSTTLGIAGFVFDYVCCNRIIWGAQEYKEVRIRHTSGAPDRWLREVMPAVEAYREASTKSLEAAIRAAQAHKLTGGLANEDAVEQFLVKRFTRTQAKAIQAAHFADEGRPIETMWDAVTGITAYARGVPYQNERVELERQAGELLAA